MLLLFSRHILETEISGVDSGGRREKDRPRIKNTGLIKVLPFSGLFHAHERLRPGLPQAPLAGGRGLVAPPQEPQCFANVFYVTGNRNLSSRRAHFCINIFRAKHSAKFLDVVTYNIEHKTYTKIFFFYE